jgi:uncharacterized protein (TIRG00374 family)
MNWRRIARTLLGLTGVVIFGVILYMGGTDALSRVIHGDPRFLLGSLLAIGMITLLGSLRWRLLVSALTQQPPLPVREIYHYNIIGRFISLFAPRGVGDFAGRPLALRAGKASSLGMAVYSTILDRMFDYILILLLAVPALLYALRLISLEVGGGLAALLVAVGFLLVATRFGQVVRWFNKLLGHVVALATKIPLLGRTVPRARVEQLRQLEDIEIDRRTAGYAYLISIAQILMILARSYLIGRALGLSLPILLLLLAAPVAQLGQLLAFTPGALGVRELSWFAVLQAAGIPGDDLLTFLVGHRAYIYVCIIVLALISQLITLAKPLPVRSLPPASGVELSE